MTTLPLENLFIPMNASSLSSVMTSINSMFKKDVGIGFLVVSSTLFAISIASYYYFLNIDYLVLPKEKWAVPSGYRKLDFVYLVLGTYFTPVAIIFMSLFISKSFKQISNRSSYKLPMYLSVTLAFFVGCIVSHGYSSEVLDCIGFFCIGTSSPTSASSGAISVSMVFFSICLYFFIALLGVAAMVGGKKYRHINFFSKQTYREIYNENGVATLTEKFDITSDTVIMKNLGNLRIAEDRHRKEHRQSWVKELILIALVFAVLYPVLIMACTLLPTWWSGFTRLKIQQYQLSVPSQGYGMYWALTLNDLVVVKLFPDIVIYYGAIYVVSLLGLLAQFWSPLRRFFHLRLTPNVCVGQALLAATLVALVVSEWCYWFFSHVWENNPKKIRTTAELAARSFGQIGNVVIGLLVLPVAKNGVWSKMFGVSWEAMIRYHKILGYTFLMIILMHMVSWWVVFYQKDSFPSDIFAVPMTYHKDNFTVPLSVLTTFFMFIIMGGFTFHLIRRKNYELFYYLHFFSGVIFISVLWHATMSWYYVTAGLILYALDNAIRLFNTVSTSVHLESLEVAVTNSEPALSTTSPPLSERGRERGGGGRGEYRSAAVSVEAVGVTKLSYTVNKASQECYRSMRHLMGQYVYINIPAVSSLEWHPFTISSAPTDSVTTHHIKVMGGVNGNQWTSKLYLLALELQRKEAEQDHARSDDEDDAASFSISAGRTSSLTEKMRKSGLDNEEEQRLLSSLVVNVDGPYGLSVVHDLHRYSHVLLIGGGIGVTPLHSCLRHLLLSKLCSSDNESGGGVERGRGGIGGGGIDSQPLPFAYPDLKKVRLIWAVKGSEEASLFADTLNLVASSGESGMFSAAVYATGNKQSTSPPLCSARTPSACLKLPLHNGRPDLRSELCQLSVHKTKALVFVCGPSLMVEEASMLSMLYGVDFRHETFEL